MTPKWKSFENPFETTFRGGMNFDFSFCCLLNLLSLTPQLPFSSELNLISSSLQLPASFFPNL